MDELKQIINYKLKLIQHYRNWVPVSIEERQQITEIFLKQKRKETSRDVIQCRLLQNLSNRKIEAPYRLEEFYAESMQMMQMYSPGFQYEEKNAKLDMIEKIVELYVAFFSHSDCARRADQIRNLVQKNLCERGMIIPTIFNWFAQWLRKTFRQFIKKTLTQYTDKKNTNLIEQNKRKRHKKFIEQINVQRASLSIIDSQIRLHKQKQLSLRGNKSRLLSPDIHKIEVKTTKNIGKSELLHYSGANQYLSLSKLKVNSTQMSPEKETIVPFSAREFGQSIVMKQKEKSVMNLNKDIFFSAFYDEIAQYYKFYNVLGQLDDNYPRSFRKVDRREEINKNMNVLVRSMARNQPNQLKSSIEDYNASYRNKFGGPVSLFDKELSQMRVKVKKRAESVDIYKQPARVEQRIHNRSFEQPQQRTLTKTQEKNEEKTQEKTQYKTQQKKPARLEAEKKKIQLELPAIHQKPTSSLHRSVDRMQKIIILNCDIPPSRYSKNKNTSDKVSAQLYKELREINSLFRGKKTHRQSLQILDKDLYEMKNNQVRFKNRAGEKDEVGELLDGNFQENGIFRLPKICR